MLLALAGSRLCTGRAGSGFILRRALCLHLLGNKSAVRLQAALDERLSAIPERVREGVSADVAHRQSLPLLLQHEIDTAIAVLD